jgi:hypothetical protein
MFSDIPKYILLWDVFLLVHNVIFTYTFSIGQSLYYQAATPHIKIFSWGVLWFDLGLICLIVASYYLFGGGASGVLFIWACLT